MLIGYLRLLGFIGLLWVALQLPSIFDQYQQRLTAQLTEAQRSLSPFQEAANKFFQGNLGHLIEEYRTSKDPEFRAQSNSVSDLHRHLLKLQTQVDSINAPWPQILQARHHIDLPLLKQVVQQLDHNSATFTVMMIMKVSAFVWVSLLILESLSRLIFAVLHYVFYVPRRIKAPRRSKK